jgi:hypothetical protein
METGCFYIPDFPAWAAQYLNPALQHVAIYERKIIVARSGSLKRSVMPGHSLEQARAFCPDASFLMRYHLKDSTVWEEIIRLIHGITPRLRPLRTGWVLLKPYDRDALQSLVMALKAQAAIAPNHGLARMAAVRAAPVHVHPDRDWPADHEGAALEPPQLVDQPSRADGGDDRVGRHVLQPIDQFRSRAPTPGAQREQHGRSQAAHGLRLVVCFVEMVRGDQRILQHCDTCDAQVHGPDRHVPATQ